MTRNHPSAYGLLAGLIVLLLGALVNVSCCSAPRVNPLEPLDDSTTARRTPLQQAQAAVAIYTECGSGSGVLVDASLVLTANHVVTCGGSPARFIAVRTLDKKSSVAIVDLADSARDIARLALVTPMTGVPPVHVRFALTGEKICASTAVPERATRCGVAGAFGGKREHGDLEVNKINIWYGNSGSGVYASDGSLIGIAVRLVWCDPGDALFYALTDVRVDTCGGRVSSIGGSPVMP